MKIEKIKPIPKYIMDKIRKADQERNPAPSGFTRRYAYLAKNDGELVKITVAVKNRYKKWYCKQVAVHGVHSNICFVKDTVRCYIGGYLTGWFEEGLQQYPKWYESAEWDTSDDKYFDMYAPIVNIEYLEKFSEYQYSAYNLYTSTDILQYLRLYEKHPKVEYMVKAGLQKYIYSKQILEKAETDKKFRKWLYANKEELTSNKYDVDVVLRSYRTKKPLEILQLYKKTKKKLRRDANLAAVRELCESIELQQIINYIVKQHTNVNSYSDYLKACLYLELDMSLPKNYFPHDFKRWHDIRIDQYATAVAANDINRHKDIYGQFALVAEKYISLQHQRGHSFICIIAKTPAELVREGEFLSHCVGRLNYDQRVVREESLIFFVRTIERPDVPFVTVEYSISQHNVLQCYGEHDQKPDEKVLHYVHDVWLPYANKRLKQIAA